MPERLVDVERKGAEVLHTFPVTVSRPADDEEPSSRRRWRRQAMRSWSRTRTDESDRQDACQPRRSTDPYGDPLGVLAETKAGLDQFVRERAYFLWEQAGRPEGRADDSGTRRSMSDFATGLTRYGSGRAVRKARRTSTGIGCAPLRRADACRKL